LLDDDRVSAKTCSGVCVYIALKYIDAIVSVVHLTIFCYVGGEKNAIGEDDSGFNLGYWRDSMGWYGLD
jgi:hypothetical protein